MSTYDAAKENYTGFGLPSQSNGAFMIVFNSNGDKKMKERGVRKLKVAGPLEFINATSSGQLAAGARGLIRTHVMSDYWRKQKKGNRRSIQDLSHTTSVFTPLRSLPLSLSQPLGGPDPFSTLPIEMKPFMYTILNRYETDIVHEICPKTKEHENHLSQCPRLIWLRMGLSDAAVLLSLLCVTALHIDVTDGNGHSLCTYALKRDALRAIGERLPDAQAGISDETITAVSLLTIEEGVACNFESWSTHMKGLKRMVELRGGLSKLDVGLQILIYIADLHGCDGKSLRSYFPWANEITCQPQFSDPSHCAGLLYYLEFGTDLEGFDEHLLSSFHLVRSLTTTMNEESEDRPEINPLVMEAATIWIRSRLSASGLRKREPEQQNIHMVYCLGVQIYLSTVIQNPVESGLDQNELISTLKSHLSHVGMQAMLSPLVLWTVFFGGLAAPTCMDRTWFVALLRDIARASNFSAWHTVESMLKSLAWVEKKHGVQGRLLWSVVTNNHKNTFQTTPISFSPT